jgi:diguanylate cyclase (GGDEF)-like protein
MGKLAVPEYILNKPGSLTPAEFEKMKLHASVGADILSAIDFPYPVVPIVRHHHESWDGSGYPDGLAGSHIPIGARILSVVDCFDALTSDRPYRPRLGDVEALRILVDRRGTMYDPLIVDTFIQVHKEIAPDSIGQQLAEREEGLPLLKKGLSVADAVTSGSGLDDIAASSEETLVLYDLARALVGDLDLAAAADVISNHTRRIVPASTCVFYGYDERSDDLYCAHAAGENAAHFSGLRIARGQRLTGWVAANKQTIVNSNPVLDLGEVARSIRPQFRSCLSTALVSNDDLVGVLTLYSPHRDAFTEDHRRIIEAVAKQVSQTLRHSVGRAQNRAPIVSDQLIGLPNRQQLNRFIEAEMSGEGNRGTLSIVFVALQSSMSHRTVRDPGKTAGRVVEAIKSGLRDGDVIFRYASNEFVVLLTHSDAEAAVGTAARIAAKISESGVGPNETAGEVLTVTLGTASAPRDGTRVEELVNAARRREGEGPVSTGSHPGSVH